MSIPLEHKDLMEKLVVAYKQGDKTVTNQMIEIMWPELETRAVSLAASNKLVHYTAEDLVCEAYVRALENIHKVENPREFIAYIKGIMYNVMLDDTKNYSKMADKEILENYDSSGGDDDFSEDFMETIKEEDGSWLPEENYDVKERNQILKDAINELPQKQREILWDFYFENKRIKEIAAERELSENTVKATLNAARNNLYKSLDEFEKKHDIRLHGLLTLPFMSSLLKEMSLPYAFGCTEKENIMSKIIEKVGENTVNSASAANTAATAAVETSAATTAATAAKAGVGTVLKSLTAKILAAVVAVAVVGGGTYYSATHPTVFSFGGLGDSEARAEEKYYDEIAETQETIVPIALGQDITGRLEIGEDGIWVKFTPAETDFYVFRTTVSSELNAENIEFNVFRGEIDLEKRSFNGTYSSNDDLDSEYILLVDDEGMLYANSTYYIRIQCFADNGITSMYLDKAERKEIPTAPQLANKADAVVITEGEDIADKLTVGENWFAFTPSATGTYRFEMESKERWSADDLNLFTYKTKTTHEDRVGYGIESDGDPDTGKYHMYFAGEVDNQLEAGVTYYLQFEIGKDNIFDSIKLTNN